MNDYVTKHEFQQVITILERIESKVDGHDRRFDAHDRRFDAHDRSFAAIGSTFASIHERFDSLEESVRHEGVLRERLEKKVDTVIEVLGTKASKEDVDDFRAEMKRELADVRTEIRRRG